MQVFVAGRLAVVLDAIDPGVLCGQRPMQLPGQRHRGRRAGADRCGFDPDFDHVAACGRIVINVVNVAAQLQVEFRVHGAGFDLARSDEADGRLRRCRNQQCPEQQGGSACDPKNRHLKSCAAVPDAAP